MKGPYFILNEYTKVHAVTGDPVVVRSYHNGTVMGMLSFGRASDAIQYPTKEAARRAIQGRKGLRVVRVSEVSK